MEEFSQKLLKICGYLFFGVLGFLQTKSAVLGKMVKLSTKQLVQKIQFPHNLFFTQYECCMDENV